MQPSSSKRATIVSAENQNGATIVKATFFFCHCYVVWESNNAGEAREQSWSESLKSRRIPGGSCGYRSGVKRKHFAALSSPRPCWRWLQLQPSCGSPQWISIFHIAHTQWSLFWLCRRVNQQLSRDIYLPLFIGQLIKIDSHNFRLCRDQLIQVLRLIGYTFQPSSDCTVKRVHNDDVIMTTTATQITSLTVVYSIVYSGADQRKHQSSASLAFVRGIHRDRWIPRIKGQ